LNSVGERWAEGIIYLCQLRSFECLLILACLISVFLCLQAVSTEEMVVDDPNEVSYLNITHC
jgi:hypothetical protein